MKYIRKTREGFQEVDAVIAAKNPLYRFIPSATEGKFIAVSNAAKEYLTLFFRGGTAHVDEARMLVAAGYHFEGAGSWVVNVEGARVWFDSDSCEARYRYCAPANEAECDKLQAALVAAVTEIVKCF